MLHTNWKSSNFAGGKVGSSFLETLPNRHTNLIYKNNIYMRNNLSSLITLSHVQKRLYRPEDVFELSRVTRLEQVKTDIYETAKEGAQIVAKRIAQLILDKQKKGEKAVISMASGRSMTDIFAELVRMHTEEGLSFSNVILFNLFEYYPLQDKNQGCYHQLKEQLIDHIDIPAENIYSFDGMQAKETLLATFNEFERCIQTLGGIDLQLLGIGRGGNIGFNEPGTQFNSQTRLVILDNVSKNDAAGLFGSVDQVPVSAITMGIGTILRAKEIIMVAWGEHKSEQVKAAVEGNAGTACPASALQQHQNAHLIIDLSAAGKLTRISHPWLVTSCEWDDQLTRRAIVWLCQQTGKPILKLTNKDYNEFGLSDLITLHGSAYNCNIKVFNQLQHTITGWPGGKPNADDSTRPERATPYPKKVLIFSPHPDDDVISMGGTFARLIKQGHNVHVAYETSGCIAVGDVEVIRFMDFMKGFQQMHIPEAKVIPQKFDEYMHFFKHEKVGDQDTREILDLKALIRRGEATAACRHMGLDTSHIHFLNLPFYETGTIKKGDCKESVARN